MVIPPDINLSYFTTVQAIDALPWCQLRACRLGCIVGLGLALVMLKRHDESSFPRRIPTSTPISVFGHQYCCMPIKEKNFSPWRTTSEPGLTSTGTLGLDSPREMHLPGRFHRYPSSKTPRSLKYFSGLPTGAMARGQQMEHKGLKS